MKRQLEQRVAALIAPIIEDMGFDLIEVAHVSEHGRWVLRITADREGGITLNDCARISRQIGDVIDVDEAVPHAYVLEVSSPGLNRPLKREKDFLGAVGRRIRVKMCAGVDGRRNFTGALQDVREGTLYLQAEGRLFLLPLKDLQKANLMVDFESTETKHDRGGTR